MQERCREKPIPLTFEDQTADIGAFPSQGGEHASRITAKCGRDDKSHNVECDQHHTGDGEPTLSGRVDFVPATRRAPADVVEEEIVLGREFGWLHNDAATMVTNLLPAEDVS